MHYYQFNIGDYRKDTGHLQPMEHYIYRQLIDWYYLDEKPIPKITQVVMRRLCLGSDGLNLLENVLADFFVLEENGYHHKRIDEELSAYKEQADKNRKNGRKGGRPKKQQLTENEKPKITQVVLGANPNQEPITNNYKPRTNIKKKDIRPVGLEFDLFYDVYPKKGTKKEAKTFWSRMSEENKQLAIDGVNNHCSGKEKNFIVDAIRYLRNERWEDEIIEPPKTEQQLRNDRNDAFLNRHKNKPEDGNIIEGELF